MTTTCPEPKGGCVAVSYTMRGGSRSLQYAESRARSSRLQFVVMHEGLVMTLRHGERCSFPGVSSFAPKKAAKCDWMPSRASPSNGARRYIAALDREVVYIACRRGTFRTQSGRLRGDTERVESARCWSLQLVGPVCVDSGLSDKRNDRWHPPPPGPAPSPGPLLALRRARH
jgi:hypothetical protein